MQLDSWAVLFWDDLGFAVVIDLYADGNGIVIIGAVDRDAFLGASCHFAAGAGIFGAEGHKTWDGRRDGVFVAGEGRGGGLFLTCCVDWKE